MRNSWRENPVSTKSGEDYAPRAGVLIQPVRGGAPHNSTLARMTKTRFTREVFP
jgi:hypothetical protein